MNECALANYGINVASLWQTEAFGNITINVVFLFAALVKEQF